MMVKFLENRTPYLRGETAELPQETAEILIKQGAAIKVRRRYKTRVMKPENDPPDLAG